MLGLNNLLQQGKDVKIIDTLTLLMQQTLRLFSTKAIGLQKKKQKKKTDIKASMIE